MSEAVEYVEIDIDWCELNYGVAPCTASIPTTGDAKCFNSLNSCQDRPNFDPGTVTLRFAVATAHLPRDIDALPWIISTDFSPAIVSLGEHLGQRASFKVTFTDHPHSDAGEGFDKYHAERGYDPYERGTFWARFRARQPFLRGQPIRWINGFVGDALADMETRHFFIESFDGPTPDGKFTITAKDALKFLDGDRSQAPALSNGFLVSAISAVATVATLSPAGIGAAEYPATGTVAIGGKEICGFTRSGDVLTIGRGEFGTTAQAHAAQDRVQLLLTYAAADPANILLHLFTNFTEVPASYIPLAAWLTETATYLNRLYTVIITEPTPVNKLVSELIEQAALALWDDNVAQQIRLQVLRGIVTDADRFSESNVMKGTFKLTDQPDKRLTQVWVYFGQIDPTKRVDDPDNYRSTAVVIDEEAEADYGAAAIKKIYARWIPALGRTIAERLGAIVLGRYKDAPRKFSFQLMRGSVTAPVLGGGYQLEWWNLQDASGAREDVPIQLTRLNPSPGNFTVDAEEMRFTAPPEDLASRFITIDTNANNLNLKTIHDSLFPAIDAGQSVTFTIAAGVIVGSASTATPAIDVGTWPVGTVNVVNAGRIQGCGGRGGTDTGAPFPDVFLGLPGGIALYTRKAISLSNADGEIWGGGGGGGGGTTAGTGGGGAGTIPGLAGAGINPGSPGTSEAGGLGGVNNFDGTHSPGGGDGGGPGLAGNAGTPFPVAGGPAGSAIDGVSFVSSIGGPGDVRGGQIN